VAQAEGDYFDWAVKTVRVDDTWLSIPIGTSTSAQVYRISFFQEAGWDDPVNNPPDTWEDLFRIGVELKKRGTPLGQAFGHSTGDPPSFAYSFMWAYGAMEVEEDGKTVAFNKPEFVDGMKLLLSYWTQAFDETGLSWDDATNNRAYLAGQIAWTFNGSSIYIAAQKDAPTSPRTPCTTSSRKGRPGASTTWAASRSGFRVTLRTSRARRRSWSGGGLPSSSGAGWIS
ncbi:MAG: hypothetical protein C4289_07345, partial [Chloroflexota bacterium]